MSKERRLQLHEILVEKLGSRNVYFQPPSGHLMKYPCIVYQRTETDVRYANNQLYKDKDMYTATVIDSDPDSDIPARLKVLPYCRFNRRFTADNLNHDVYNIYF